MAEVTRNVDKSRYEIVVDGKVIGFAEYTIDGDVLTAPGTQVDPDYGGQGYAGMVVEQLLKDAREADQSVIPSCPYVAHYIAKNPEHLDLVPEDRRDEFGL